MADFYPAHPFFSLYLCSLKQPGKVIYSKNKIYEVMMENNNDFTEVMLVDQSPKQVFEAINSPQDWWSGEIEGRSTALNDEFTYRYKDLHRSKQKVVEFIPEERVMWLVTDSAISYVEDKQEWTGTKIVFEITRRGAKTELRFTHVGLKPVVECFDACSTTWSKLMQVSLCRLIETGKTEKPILD